MKIEVEFLTMGIILSVSSETTRLPLATRTTTIWRELVFHQAYFQNLGASFFIRAARHESKRSLQPHTSPAFN
jgi:hypothetical protein